MKLSWIFSITALSVSAALSGCTSSGKNPSDELLNQDLSVQASQALSTQIVCCQDFSQISYQPFSNGRKLINANSPAMQFEHGKSYFYAARIDDQFVGKSVSVSSVIGKTTLPLQVILLKTDFQVSRVIPANAFSLTDYTLLSSPVLKANISLLPDERLIILAADNQYLGKSITVPHPEKLKEKATGIVAKPLPDIQIPFSSWGVIELSTQDSGAITNLFKSDSTVLVTQTSVPATNPVVMQSAPAVATPAMISSKATISAQTKAYYQQAITQAVKENQLEQAMQLVTEAKQLGYSEAETVFIQAVKAK